jgi:hypothetical protein
MQQTGRPGFILGFMAVGVLAVAIGVAWAVSSNGPYYALPAWDQKLPAATRFVLLTDWNNEAVLDRETGLVWERSPATTTAVWVEARFICASKTLGGRKGWRLPAFAELASLIDPSVPLSIPFPPHLPSGHPFLNVQSEFYWSATTYAARPTAAWGVVFFGKEHVVSAEKTNPVLVWCVRGGTQASEY